MKAAIHPSYGEIRVHCACGNAFITRCRIERFRRKYAKSDAGKVEAAAKQQ